MARKNVANYIGEEWLLVVEGRSKQFTVATHRAYLGMVRVPIASLAPTQDCIVRGIVCAEHCPWAASNRPRAEVGIGDSSGDHQKSGLCPKGPARTQISA